MLNDDTDRTKAIISEHVPHRLVRLLNRLFGERKDAGITDYDVFMSFNNDPYPSVLRITDTYKKRKLDC